VASIATSPKGLRRILFYDGEGQRKTVHLGKCSKRDAETVKLRLESILTSKLLGNPIAQDDASWLADAGATVRPKLEAVGLVDPSPTSEKPAGKTLAAFLDDFVERHGPTKKPATVIVWGQVVRMLNRHLPKGILLEDVTVGHCKNFHEKLRKAGLAPATIHKRIGFARQFFQDAVDWELIAANPFRKVKTAAGSAKSNVEVPRAVIDRILEKCDPTWEGIIRLSRFGGLRCPSEVLSLTWGHVDFEAGRMSIPEPKVAHHEGRGLRECPIFPELRPCLERLFELATVDGRYPSAGDFVVDKPAYRAAAMRSGGWANSNLRTQFEKILARAGVTPWRRLFHSMRATRQTELSREFPLHVVCAWLGNSEQVAKRNYLLVTDADFDRANGGERRDTKTTRAASKEAIRGTKTTLHDARTKPQETPENPGNPGKTDVFPRLPGLPEMEVKGLEPMTLCLQSRCSPN
jgi:integrase